MKQKLLYFFIAALCFAKLTLAQNANEEIAENWIKNNSKKLDIQPEHDFKMLFNRKGPSGETLRYYQMVNDVQVYDAELTIHINTLGDVSYTASTYDKTIYSINTTPDISVNTAINTAVNHLKVDDGIAFQKEKLFVYNHNGATKLVHQIIIEPAATPVGSWEVIVDAKNGDILSSEDKAFYYNHHNKEKRKKKKENKNNSSIVKANATGYVYLADPLSDTGNQYGGSFVDGNGQGDTNNAALEAARSNVTLLDLTISGGEYTLDGPFASIVDSENPKNGFYSQVSSAFDFNRNDDGFEAVNTYYHVDKSMRYINNTLGITLMPYQYSGGVRYDPHGLNGSDNSHYSPGSGQIAFGEGCVDDAEDADVIIHELGHGIHGWLTNGSTAGQFGEGSGDYWAQSYSRSLNQWSSGDAEFHYMFHWDGHNPCWGGRITNSTKVYPTNIVNQVHSDGEIWSAALMEIFDIIGRTKTDAAFLEGLANTNSGSNQQDAARAVRQAAMDMVLAGQYGMTCADVDVFTARFSARGYSMPALDCNALDVSEFEIKDISIFPNPATNSITIKNIKQDFTIEVYNIIGQKIKNQNITPDNNTIDVSSLSNGAYILKLKGYDGAMKFIKL
jgi:Zn-dependent metalloprotease